MIQEEIFVRKLCEINKIKNKDAVHFTASLFSPKYLLFNYD